MCGWREWLFSAEVVMGVVWRIANEARGCVKKSLWHARGLIEDEQLSPRTLVQRERE